MILLLFGNCEFCHCRELTPQSRCDRASSPIMGAFFTECERKFGQDTTLSIVNGEGGKGVRRMLLSRDLIFTPF